MTDNRKLVSLVRCPSYQPQGIRASLQRSIDLLGGLEEIFDPGEKVLLKPNLLQPARPEKHITTHPEVVLAAARMIRDCGCRVIIADSPGGPTYTRASLQKLYSGVGLHGESGIELNLDCGYREVAAHDGSLIKRFLIINPALEADAVVVISKAKTHLLTGMTGAAKNLFGVVPGIEKSAMHARLPDTGDFSDMILDLNFLMNPRLQIMDAVVGLEGDGPMGGRPKEIGAILASRDFSAIDVATSRLMSFNPMDVSTIKAAARRGLVREDLGDIRIAGDEISELIVDDFKKPATRSRVNGYLNHLIQCTAKSYSLKPGIVKAKCTGCERCLSICPKKAVHMAQGKAYIEDKDCIRCYCCHEICQSGAVDLHRSLIGRVMAWVADGDGK